jgi:hypothetical protein
MMERGFYTTYSRIRSIDGHGSGSTKNPRQINNSSRTIYLAGKIVQHTKKLAKLFFSSRESQNYIFSVWFVGVFFAVASDGENSRGYECYVVEIGKPVKYAE